MLSIWPPIVWIVLQSIGFGVNCSKGLSDGISSALAFALVSALLWWGNFFAPLGF